MWTTNSHEHILFMTVDEVSEDTLQEVRSLLENYMEPRLVRNDNKYPAKNHMYSYLTIAILSEKSMDKTLVKKVRKF